MTADWRKLYPFESHFVPQYGQRQHYLDEGHGAPLVMVHGNPTWSFYWRNLVLGLRDEYRCVVPDHMGCGLSDKPQSYSYTLAQHTQNLIQLIDRLDLRGATLLAHDWGGAIGLGAAVARPDRFARMILFNTGAFPPPYVPHRIRACRWPLLGPWALRQLNLFARAALTMAVEKPERMTPEVRAGLLAPYDSWEHRVAIWRFVADIPLSKRHPTYQTLVDLEAQLPTLANRPVQLIWGMKDWCFTDVCCRRLQVSFPQATVTRLPDAGHYVIEDAHERIIPLVKQFLTS
ncbi:MAG: alpha/beta fold hydrolase [Planctomycetota bacterium]